MDESPVISVIISNFNGRRFLDRLLASLRAQRDVVLDIIVVDRLSRDGSREFLEAQPDVRVVSEPPQTGLVSGYAAGAKVARFPLLFFANEDLWLDPDCLSRLAARIDVAAKVGMSDPWEWDYDGGRLHRAGVRFEKVRWDGNCPWPWLGFDFVAPLSTGERIPFPCAGAFMIHRTCYDDLEGFDTGFFLDFEDTDLGVRAWQRGWLCVTVAEARVFHAVGASNPQSGGRRYISNRTNFILVALKSFSWRALPVVALTWATAFAGNLRQQRWARVWGDLLAVRQVIGRLPEVALFRRVNAAYTHYLPGERFFQAAEFRKTPPRS
jgi:GT2 family glycosyltransferase